MTKASQRVRKRRKHASERWFSMKEAAGWSPKNGVNQAACAIGRNLVGTSLTSRRYTAPQAAAVVL